MQITVDWLKSQFELFNKEYFGGELPTPKFSISNARTRLGAMIYKYRQRGNVRTCHDYTIRLSNYYDIPEKEFQNVLLHEMIHYYILIKQLKDTASHGMVFRRMMSQLNERGWNICVRTDTRNWAQAGRNADKEEAEHIVLAIQTVSGKYILSVASPSYIHYLNKIVSTSKDIRSYAWYISRDNYFSTFQRVRTPRGRLVSRQTFEEKIASMTPLKFAR